MQENLRERTVGVTGDYNGLGPRPCHVIAKTFKGRCIGGIHPLHRVRCIIFHYTAEIAINGQELSSDGCFKILLICHNHGALPSSGYCSFTNSFAVLIPRWCQRPEKTAVLQKANPIQR